MVASTLRLASSSLSRSSLVALRTRTLPRIASSTPLLSATATSTRSQATPLAATSLAALNSRFQIPGSSRGYADSAALSRQEIQNRILELLQSFEKVDPTKLSADAHFTKTLGLDSLDAVEVVMAIEEEFSIEIPDEDADAIQTVGQAIEYISKTPEAM